MKINLDGLQALQELYIPIPPVPASRPKVSRWSTYYGKNHMQYIKSWGAWLDQMPQVWEYLDKDDRLAVSAEFVCKRPKKFTSVTPRGDLDNYLKLVLDCLTNSNFWHDDKAVEFVIAHKRYATEREEPHTTVRVFTV